MACSSCLYTREDCPDCCECICECYCDADDDHPYGDDYQTYNLRPAETGGLAEVEILGRFTDPVSGQPCELVSTRGLTGIHHPGCAELADLSVELDAFYCRVCRISGRVSGAWCADLIERSAVVR